MKNIYSPCSHLYTYHLFHLQVINRQINWQSKKKTIIEERMFIKNIQNTHAKIYTAMYNYVYIYIICRQDSIYNNTYIYYTRFKYYKLYMYIRNYAPQRRNKKWIYIYSFFVYNIILCIQYITQVIRKYKDTYNIIISGRPVSHAALRTHNIGVRDVVYEAGVKFQQLKQTCLVLPQKLDFLRR